MLERLSRLFAPRAKAAAEGLPADGGTAEDWKNRGNAHFANGEFDLAADCYRQAIAADPAYAEAYNNLGRVCLQQGRLAEAEELLKKALDLRPDLANGYLNLGILRQTQGHLGDAIGAYRQALALKPDWSTVHNRLGIALSESGRREEALACFETAAALDPTSAEALYNLGDAYLEVARPDDARRPTELALRLAPGFARAHHNLGKIFLAENRLDDALACLNTALTLDGTDAAAHDTLGVVLHKQDRLAEAIACYERARAATPHDHALLRNLGLALLGHGRLAQGWDCYEHRFQAGTAPRVFSVPEWRGEDLAGKTLLVWGEQGIGDEILYANAYAQVIARADRCVIECAPKLVPLFASSFPKAQVVPRTDPPHAETRSTDLQCAAGMLAKWLRPTLESFPKRAAYLNADTDRKVFWQARLGALGSGLKVGFSWRSHNAAGVRALYYTDLDQWGPIFAVPGVHFVNLQYDRCAEELDEARRRFNVPLHSFDEVDLFDDLAEAAALKQALDLVISAPTSTAFLSAAVGTSTWMMSYATPWHTLGTDHVPWFPSMRCFPRRWNQDWNEIIADIARQLAALSGTGHA